VLRSLIAVCACLAGVAAAWAVEPPERPPAREPMTPAEKYRALDREELALDNSLPDKLPPGANVRKERERLRKEYAARMLDLAETYPDDPAAIDALGWVFGHLDRGEETERALKSLAQYTAGDLKPEMLDAAASSIWRLGLVPGQEEFLRQAFENNRHRKVRASAGHRLAYLLKLYSENGDTRNPGPAVAAKRAAEAERLYEKVIADYGDVPYYFGTVAERAGPELFELRDLAIGKTVPEIEAEDLGGVKFKLSDYRGKVVMLDFWGDW
jgi:hypothetical protein